jgi:two-component system, sensor histidine kinase YesM
VKNDKKFVTLIKNSEMYRKGFFLILLFVLALFSGKSQNTGYDSLQSIPKQQNLEETSGKLIKSMKEKKSDDEIAEDYYEVAMELSRAGEYAKAESYLQKAIRLVSSKMKSSRLSVYYRELAKIQEQIGQGQSAAESYKRAADISENKSMKQINLNDAGRVKSSESPQMQLNYLEQNVQLMNTNPDMIQSKDEIARTYVEMATTNKMLNQPEIALENYRNALTKMDVYSSQYFSVKGEMVNLLAGTDNVNEAIELQQEAITQSSQTGNTVAQVQQMKKLSDLYFSNNMQEKGLELLHEAYRISIERGNLENARKSLMLLVDYYRNHQQPDLVLELYDEFVANLDSLVYRDVNLIDAKLFQVNEERIEQLERERDLQNELIQRKNRDNAFLISILALLVVFVVFIFIAWLSIRKKNKRIALQSLRREMNPHFIFNSLNSINNYIANNNELEANKYLTSYSSLLRNMMETSNNDYIPLSLETEQLRKYLELEKLRFQNKFEYEIIIDDDVDVDSVMIPNMLIQPNLENAVWHGLRYKESKGFLKLHFSRNGGQTMAMIEDNGIGIRQSRILKTKHQQMHESRGLKNVQERIRLLNELYKTDIRFEITEKEEPETGVIVTIKWK